MTTRADPPAANVSGGRPRNGPSPPPPPISDINTVFPAYLDGARSGRAADLGRLFEAARPYLLRVAEEELDAALRPKAGAEDLVQDTFLEAQRAFGTFRGRTAEEFVGWVRGILRHNLADFWRGYLLTGKRRAGREVPLEKSAAAAQVPDPGTPPPDKAEAAEERKRVEQALAGLPEDYRHVLQLRYGRRLKHAQIAEALGCSVNAAQKLWARAIEQLRREVGR